MLLVSSPEFRKERKELLFKVVKEDKRRWVFFVDCHFDESNFLILVENKHVERRKQSVGKKYYLG